ncbi:unnamed protein product [Xylocopa violacea]|uniref:Cytochrome b-c1 complex subunit 6 n=1 Tax=Xylocopa violacea TaxID=135666 RepID=A0ABP1P858_XYLVO
MSFLQNFLNHYFPTVRADDEEVIDPQKVLRAWCSRQKKCSDLQVLLDICNDRVSSKKQTEETCMEELLDYVECVDQCVAKRLFSKLK